MIGLKPTQEKDMTQDPVNSQLQKVGSTFFIQARLHKINLTAQ